MYIYNGDMMMFLGPIYRKFGYRNATKRTKAPRLDTRDKVYKYYLVSMLSQKRPLWCSHTCMSIIILQVLTWFSHNGNW